MAIGHMLICFEGMVELLHRMHDRLSVGLQTDDSSTVSTVVMDMIRSGLMHIREHQRLEAQAPPTLVDRVEQNIQIRRRRVRVQQAQAAEPEPESFFYNRVREICFYVYVIIHYA